MDLTQIIVTIITVIFAGGLGVYFTYLLNNRKEDSNQFSVLIEEYKILRSEEKLALSKLRIRLDKLETKEREMLLEIQSLQNKLLIFEGSHTDIPLPTWLKDVSGKMLFINKEYEDLFLNPNGISLEDYIGYTDHDVWPESVADSFTKHDMLVIRTKKPTRVIEIIDISGVRTWLEVLKYPRKFKSKVIGIGGIVLRQSSSKITLNY